MDGVAGIAGTAVVRALRYDHATTRATSPKCEPLHLPRLHREGGGALEEAPASPPTTPPLPSRRVRSVLLGPANAPHVAAAQKPMVWRPVDGGLLHPKTDYAPPPCSTDEMEEAQEEARAQAQTHNHTWFRSFWVLVSLWVSHPGHAPAHPLPLLAPFALLTRFASPSSARYRRRRQRRRAQQSSHRSSAPSPQAALRFAARISPAAPSRRQTSSR